MYELVNDSFYELIKIYDRSVVEYCLIADEKPYKNLNSHKEAVLFGITKVIDRVIAYINKYSNETEQENSKGIFPWKHDIEKASAKLIDANDFLFVPELLNIDKSRNNVYNCDYENKNTGESIPYWYAFLEPPYGAFFVHRKNGEFEFRRNYNPDDLKKINKSLFPNGISCLEVYEWTTNWSNYFDAGHEWWGASCWSIYDKSLNRYVVIFVSSTD